MALECPHFGGGYSAHRLVSGTNPADLFGRHDADEDSRSVHDASPSDTFAAAIRTAMEAANGGTRTRPQGSGQQQTAPSVGVQHVLPLYRRRDLDSPLFYRVVNRKSTHRRRGPAKILGIDETAATAIFQSRTSKVARHCVGTKMDAQDVSAVEWNPASGTSDTRGEAPSTDLGDTHKNVGSTLEREGDIAASSTAAPKECWIGKSMCG